MFNSTMFRIVASAIGGLFFCGQLVFAQVNTGTITGTVKDKTGAVMPGATVVIANEDTGISRTVQTEPAGRYAAPSLSLGNYRVTASLPGFQTEARNGIELTVGREAVVNFELQVGAVSQAVEVFGEAPLVESTTAAVGSLVDERTIRELPLNGRSYDQLALLQPGVIGMGANAPTGTASFDYGSGARFSVSGSRTYANSFLLDGTDINDHANGTPGGAGRDNLGVDGIREFRILTNTFSAEYGRASGGVISAVTRSGTNQLHGSGFEFIRNSALDARNFFDVSRVPPFKRNQFGASLGGPIKKDHTFFFGTYEGLRQGLGTTLIAFVPTPAAKQGILPAGAVPVNPAVKPFLALYPNPNGRNFGDGTGEYLSAPNLVTNENYFMMRMDHQITEKMSLFGRYSFDQGSYVNPTSPTNLPNIEQTLRSRRQYSTIQVSNIPSPAWLNNFLFAYNRSDQSNDSFPTIPLGPEVSFNPGQTIGTVQFGSSANAVTQSRTVNSLGTSSTTPRFWAYNLFEVSDGVTYVKGRHALKIGGDFKRIRDNAAENTSLRGTYTFADFRGLLAGTPTNFESVLPGEHAYRGYRQSIYAVYAQDDMKVNARLTANLGLRWEATNDPTEVNGLSSQLLNPSDPQLTVTKNVLSVTKKNFEPRVGFAWQVNGKGSTVLRSGFGVYHDHMLPGIYASNVSKNPPFYYLMQGINPSFPDAYKNLSGEVPKLQGINPTQKEATKIQYNLNLQQQILKDMLLEVAYIGSESSHLLFSTEINYTTPVFVNAQPFFPRGAPRINSHFNTMRNMWSAGNANYNALQVTVRRRSAMGLQYQVFYTFSKSLDSKSSTSTGDTASEPNTALNPFNWMLDRGLSGFNATHNFVFYTSYPLPFQFQQKATRALLGGWTINGIGTFSSGRPFTARVGFNQSNDGDGQSPDRPNLLPGRSSNPVLGGPDKYFDRTVFALPAFGTLGNLGRSTLIGPGIANFDASLEKNFAITERVEARFRAEFFNLFNRANFGLPSWTIFTSSGAFSGSAGRITTTTTSSRQIQFGLKVIF